MKIAGLPVQRYPLTNGALPRAECLSRLYLINSFFLQVFAGVVR